MTTVTIYGRPEFQIPMSESLVISLCECSRLHYDGLCKKASEYGNFLYGLRMATEFNKKDYVATLTMHHLDTLLKITEVPKPNMTKEAIEEVGRFIDLVIGVVLRYKKEYMTAWTAKIEVKND